MSQKLQLIKVYVYFGTDLHIFVLQAEFQVKPTYFLTSQQEPRNITYNVCRPASATENFDSVH